MYFKPNRKEDSKLVKTKLPFSEYIGEDAAAQLKNGMDTWKAQVEQELEETKKEVTKNMDNLKSGLSSIFTNIEGMIPESEPGSRDPEPSEGGLIEDTIGDQVSMPPPVPPRVDLPTPEPAVGGQEALPQSPSEESTPNDGSLTIELPTKLPDEDLSENTNNEGQTLPKDSVTKVIDMVQEMLKTFDKANQAILQRVQDLESSLRERSQEIKQESKDAFHEAIERTRKIKQAMYEAEVKDLQLQKIAFSILDDCEDKAIEREKKISELFNKTSS